MGTYAKSDGKRAISAQSISLRSLHRAQVEINDRLILRNKLIHSRGTSWCEPILRQIDYNNRFIDD